MFPLYKKRNFSDYISDTFLFFRLNGKHFFKLYFTVNGAFIIIASALIYFVSKVYFEFLFSAMLKGTFGQTNSIESLIQNNSETFIVFGIFGIVFLLFISMIQFAFPVIYLDLLNKKQSDNFGVKEIIHALKGTFFKLIKFIIGFIFILVPLFIVVFTVNFLLCFVIIGIPLFLITIPAAMSWMHLIFYHYITSEKKFFSALSEAFSDLKQQFWQIILSTMVMYIIIQIVLTIFTMIPYIFGIATILTSTQNPENTTKNIQIATIMLTSMMVISYILNYILNNLLLINGGLVYYSSREHNESISSNNSIDLIGTDSE